MVTHQDRIPYTVYRSYTIKKKSQLLMYILFIILYNSYCIMILLVPSCRRFFFPSSGVGRLLCGLRAILVFVPVSCAYLESSVSSESTISTTALLLYIRLPWTVREAREGLPRLCWFLATRLVGLSLLSSVRPARY